MSVRFRAGAAVLLLPVLAGVADAPPSGHVGDFEDHADVGAVTKAGSADYDPARREYRITAAGENIWGKQDAFHFVWKKVSGDFSISADVRFVGAGGNAHRKACLMARQSLDADAAYADVAVHGDGLISLQFRAERGGATREVQSKTQAPATVRLERRGREFVLSVTPPGAAAVRAGDATVVLHDPVYVGLALCAHDAAATESAVFSQVSFAK